MRSSTTTRGTVLREFFQQNRSEQAPIRNLYTGSRSHVCSTLLARVRVPFRRSSIKPILRCKRESSPRNVPVGGSPPEKKGSDNFFRATRECSLEEYSGCVIVQNMPESGICQRRGRFLYYFPSVRLAISACLPDLILLFFDWSLWDRGVSSEGSQPA